MSHHLRSRRILLPQSRRPRRPRLARPAAGLVLVAAVPFLVGCAGKVDAERGVSTAVEAPRIAVRVAPVRNEPARTRVEVTGIVASQSEVPLGFKIGGVVAELGVDEGDRVTRGQTLARLELDEIDGRLSQARAALEQRQRDLDRVRGLYADGAATAEELENTETAVRVATSEVEIASFNRDYATIRAPVSGWVLDRRAEPGQLVGQAEPVLVVGSAESGWVLRVGLADRDVVRIARGAFATVELAALPGTTLEARVTRIAETADPRTGTFEVELQLERAAAVDARIKSGFVARATLEPEVGSGLGSETPTVPVEALVRADGREGLVYGVEPESGRFWPVPIDIAGFEGESLLVRSGLEQVAWVITEGADRLTRDAQLDIVASEEDPAGADRSARSPRGTARRRPETGP